MKCWISYERKRKLSTSETTATLSEIINNLDEDDLRELCSSYCDDTNDENNTNAVNEFFACQLLNLLQCYGSQFVRLILLIIFLYAWNNQMTNNYLMISNCQLTNAISDLLQDCMENNCKCKNK